MSMWARGLGVVTGLSMSSLVVSQSVEGTHAMFLSQATTSMSFSAAKSFGNGSDVTLTQCLKAIKQVLLDMAVVQLDLTHVKNSSSCDEASRWVTQMKSDVEKLHEDYQLACDLETSLAHADATKGNSRDDHGAQQAVVQGETHLNSGVTLVSAASIDQLASSSSNSDAAQATAAISSLAGANAAADADLAEAQKILAQLLAAVSSGFNNQGGTDVTTSVYGSVYSGVYGAVYGGGLPPNNIAGIIPAKGMSVLSNSGAEQ